MANPENQELELELTYLAKGLPVELTGTTPVRLVDVYIPKDPTVHSRLRLRQKGDRYEATKKVPVNSDDASAQVEHTIPLEKLEFDALAPVSDKRIEKDRYNVSLNGFPAEVDVFQGLLKGLVLIDFEFSTEEEKDSFVAPEQCLADVTQEDFIAGGQLAGRSYEDIRPDLDRFNYTPLNEE